MLSLDEYLDMHAAVGHRTRYGILYRLVHGGDASPAELADVLGAEDNTLHYHLNELLDGGLVEKRQRTEKDRDGLDTYYRATVFGEVTLTEGVAVGLVTPTFWVLAGVAVLQPSWSREFSAGRTAPRATGDPAALACALVVLRSREQASDRTTTSNLIVKC